MLIYLVNIKRDGDIVSCNYYDTNPNITGYIEISLKQGKVINCKLCYEDEPFGFIPAKVAYYLFKLVKENNELPDKYQIACG